MNANIYSDYPEWYSQLNKVEESRFKGKALGLFRTNKFNKTAFLRPTYGCYSV